MGGMFSKKAKVTPGPPRTNSAPAAMENLGRCSPETSQSVDGRRPSSADDVTTDRQQHHPIIPNSPPRTKGMGATAVAALRPFEKHGHDGTKPSGVIPDGSEVVRIRDETRRYVSRRQRPVFPHEQPFPPLFFFARSQHDMSLVGSLFSFFGFFTPTHASSRRSSKGALCRWHTSDIALDSRDDCGIVALDSDFGQQRLVDGYSEPPTHTCPTPPMCPKRPRRGYVSPPKNTVLLSSDSRAVAFPNKAHAPCIFF